MHRVPAPKICQYGGIVPPQASIQRTKEFNMKRRLMMATAGCGIAAATAVAGYMGSAAKAEREDCPGKIVCPLTGGLVCADECPIKSGETTAAPVAEAPACCAPRN